MKRRDFAKAIAGVAAGVIVAPRVFASDDLAMREMSEAFSEGVLEVSPMGWSPQTAAFGQSWLRNRLSESNVEYFAVRDAARERARTAGRLAADVAAAEGKSEIQVRHLQTALQRLELEAAQSPALLGDCPFD